MHSVKIAAHTLIAILILTLSACGPSPAATPVPTANINPETATPEEKDFEDFDPNNFGRSARADNKFFPLTPGTQYIYEGTTVEDGVNVPHRLIITVTDLTKVIGGVRSVVTWDRDFSSDELVEAELAFFAQDKDGNVWRMGEYPEEYENGKLVGAPTWIHGFQNAHAGLAMQVDPRLNTSSYSEGWGPAVDWTDRGKVDQMGVETCVPVSCYKDVLVIAESSKTEQGAFQLKHYAPGVGNILTDWRGTDQTQEKLELVQLTRLDDVALADARIQAIELEKHAYKVSSMYAQTTPVEFPEGTPAFTLPVSGSVQLTPLPPDPGDRSLLRKYILAN